MANGTQPTANMTKAIMARGQHGHIAKIIQPKPSNPLTPLKTAK